MVLSFSWVESNNSNYKNETASNQHIMASTLLDFEQRAENLDELPDERTVEQTSPNNSAASDRGQHSRHSGGGDDGGAEMGTAEQQQEQQQQEQQQQHDQSEDQQIQDGGEKEENPRPWSELKTKAGKERKRLPLACIVCRRKKIRCSGEKPACKHCFRSRIPCVYKVTTRKAAPRTDYMAMLDKRLKRMEERVIKIIPKDVSRDMAGIGRASVKPPAAGHAPRAAKASSNKKRSADEAFRAEMNDWMQEGTAGRDSFPGSWEPRMGDEKKLLLEGAEFLPSMDIQEHLAEVFFDYVYGQSYLLLHKPSFMRRLKAGAVPPVLMLAICAVSARFSSHPQLFTEPAFLRGESWADAAASIALGRHDEPNITILTVFLILGLHEFGACHGGRSWSFGGQALRMAYALQLHQELDYDPLGNTLGRSEVSFTDQEIRRRTMWACVLMDRFNSSGSQRPPSGNEKYLQIQLPIKESHFQMEIPGPTESLDGTVLHPVPEGIGLLSNPKDNMGVSAYLIRAVMLWGRIVDYLNLGGKQKDPYPLWSPESGYSSLTKKIEELSRSLPISLKFTLENLRNHAAEKIANQFLFLHIVIHQNILFLNRFAIPLSPGGRPPKDIPRRFLSDAGRAAVEAAGHISVLIKQASNHLLTVPFAGYCAYAASTVHIWGIFCKNEQFEKTSKEHLRHTYGYLNKMKQFWGMFHYMVESAKDRYRHFAEAALKGPTAGAGTEGSSMFQYGDWFDKYPHGVSRQHWEEPSPEVRSEQGGDAVMGQQSDLQSVEDFFASLSPPPPPGQPRKGVKRRNTNAGERPQRHTAVRDTKNRFEASDILPQPPPIRPEFAQRPIPGASSQTIMQQTPTTHDFANFPHPGVFSPAQAPNFNLSAYKYSLNTNLPQLDRHLVYDAYDALGPVSATSLHNMPSDNGIHNTTAPALNHTDPTNANSFWNMQLDMAGDGTIWPSGTTQAGAWFLPFNLDPTGGGGGGGDFHISTPAAAVTTPQPNPASGVMPPNGSSFYGSPGVLDLSMGVGNSPAAGSGAANVPASR